MRAECDVADAAPIGYASVPMAVGAPYPRDIPPVWLALAMAAMAALHSTVPLATVLPLPWNRLGYVVIAFAVALPTVSALRFRRRGTAVRPFREATTLVTDGPYRFTRNPMYLGLGGVALGMALCLGTASPLLVPPLFWLLLDRRFVRREEAFLRERFGASYDAYCGRVPRWL